MMAARRIDEITITGESCVLCGEDFGFCGCERREEAVEEAGCGSEEIGIHD